MCHAIKFPVELSAIYSVMTTIIRNTYIYLPRLTVECCFYSCQTRLIKALDFSSRSEECYSPVPTIFSLICKFCLFLHALRGFDKVPTWLLREDYSLSVPRSLLLQRPECEAAPCCRAGLPPTLPCTYLLCSISATT